MGIRPSTLGRGDGLDVRDFARFQTLRHPTWERAAHRVEQLVRSRGQRVAIRDGGRLRNARIGRCELPLDLANLREYLMFRALAQPGGAGYEPGTTRLLRDALRPGSVFLDVGANLGYFTLFALDLVAGPSEIVAVEPNPETFQRLTRNVRANDSRSVVRLVHAAASDREGSARLFHSPLDDSRDSLHPVGQRSAEVPTVRLDSLDLRGREVVAKIDAEGSEFAVLEGMGGICATADSLTLALEWNPPFAGRALWERLDREFTIRRIVEAVGAPPIPVHSFREIQYRLTNLWLEQRT